MRPAHPSGRPIRHGRIVGKPVWRIPDKGPVVPRLQSEVSNITAIGFTAQIAADDDE